MASGSTGTEGSGWSVTRRPRPLTVKPKFLIFSAPFGSGHTRAAQALASAMRTVSCGAEVTVLEGITPRDRFFGTMASTYLTALRYWPEAYGYIYRWSSSGKASRLLPALILRANLRIARTVSGERPRHVLATHPFAAVALGHLRACGAIGCPVSAVVTDFSVHPLWFHPGVDTYFVSNDQASQTLQDFGVSPRRIKATGIPIDPEFARIAGGERICYFPGVEKRFPRVLIMGGGLGLGPMEEVLLSVAGLSERLEVTVLAGRNVLAERRLRDLARALPNPVKVLGYTSEVASLMRRADLLVTKPGGLTCSEALACGLPMVLYDPLPGPEEGNASFLIECGAAVGAPSAAASGSLVRRLLFSPESKLHDMRKAALRLGRPRAAIEIAGYIAGERYMEEFEPGRSA